MIIVIEGATGSGKTFFQARLGKTAWKKKLEIYPNFPLWYDEEKTGITRWTQLYEVFHIFRGVILIDEVQKLADAHNWQKLPSSFKDKIAQHRKHHLDIIGTTQDFFHIDKRIRDNVHERYSCTSKIRFPKNERIYPLFQIIRVRRWQRTEGEGSVLRWVKGNARFFFISRFWTKRYYNTYADIGMQQYLCKGKITRKNPNKPPEFRALLYSRDIEDRGKSKF